ncbi:MAG: Omp28 family outer membrane lipoprotein [Bacteroidales bacterium]|nr:Omp28 family outer membrane lipoprotein [Bacteroidales bacterium]
MKILSSLPAAVAALLMFVGCDSVAPDDRYTIIDDSEFVPQRSVLVEEFTGQTCVNCPGAHELMASLESRMNSADHIGIISVGIHTPLFGFDAPRGFVTEESDYYSSMAESAPSARINRRYGVVNTDKWTGSILAEVVRKSPISFSDLNARINRNGFIDIAGRINCADDVDDCRLQLWLVEDDIVAPQLTSEKPIADYVHHSVFRKSINDRDGDPIEVKRNSSIRIDIENFVIPEFVSNNENLRIVAFVFNEKEGVLNAAQFPVQQPN